MEPATGKDPTRLDHEHLLVGAIKEVRAELVTEQPSVLDSVR